MKINHNFPNLENDADFMIDGEIVFDLTSVSNQYMRKEFSMQYENGDSDII